MKLRRCSKCGLFVTYDRKKLDRYILKLIKGVKKGVKE